MSTPKKTQAKKAAPRRKTTEEHADDAAQRASDRRDVLTARDRQFIHDFWNEQARVENEKEQKQKLIDEAVPFWLRFYRERKALLAWLLFGTMGVLGFWRIETAIDEERKTRERFDVAEEREEREEEQESIDACKIRNFSTRNARHRDEVLFEALRQEFPDAQAILSLESLVLPPDVVAQEDRDCNRDGVLNEDDYLS